VDEVQELSLNQWHQRYLQQAQWTKEIREVLFTRAEPQIGNRVLEVGSGTGALLQLLAETHPYELTGVDIQRPALTFARKINQSFNLVQADGHTLPFANDTFAISFCHYLLLWVQNPARILAEMHRVTKPGGCVIALAEPDHQSRIDYPPPLDELGKFQTRALEEQGADTALGRKLKSLFKEAGFENVETGIIGAQWTDEKRGTDDEMEWMMIHADLADYLSDKELSHYHQLDRRAYDQGKRILYIPTFYAVGSVP